jgi:hypothetical protein
MASQDPHDGRPDDAGDELIRHLVDLQGLVDAGVLEEVLVPGEPSSYELTELGQQVAELLGLLTDVQALVEVGLVQEVVIPGQHSRYAPNVFSEPAPASAHEPRHEFPLDWPEPCPVCGRRAGFDGGGRCLACGTYWPPEM